MFDEIDNAPEPEQEVVDITNMSSPASETLSTTGASGVPLIYGAQRVTQSYTPQVSYSFGLLFDLTEPWVALIRKKRGPENLRGKLNAIGGHMEAGESALDTTVREFEEETGHKVDAERWAFVMRMGNPWFALNLFAAYGDTTVLKSTTDEEVRIVDIGELQVRNDIAPDVKWMVPMAINKLVYDGETYDILVQDNG